MNQAKIYSNCEEIPARVFFKILETKDLNLLCYQGKSKELDKVWNSIQKEYEKLTSDEEYIFDLNVKNDDLIKINRINALIAISWSKHLEPDKDVTEFEKHFGVLGLSEKELKMVIDRERTRLIINQDRRKGKEKKVSKESKSFYDIMVILEDGLGRNIDDNISLAKWVSECKLLEIKRKSLQKAYGRKNNSK